MYTRLAFFKEYKYAIIFYSYPVEYTLNVRPYTCSITKRSEGRKEMKRGFSKSMGLGSVLKYQVFRNVCTFIKQKYLIYISIQTLCYETLN